MPSLAHWTTPYLGTPYQRGAMDCWGFFRHVQRERFGRELADVPTPGTMMGIARALTAGVEPSGWRAVTNPADGDGVLMGRLRHPAHVGTWVGDLGAVLHCVEGGSILSDRFHLQAGRWRVHGFYRPGA